MTIADDDHDRLCARLHSGQLAAYLDATDDRAGSRAAAYALLALVAFCGGLVLGVWG